MTTTLRAAFAPHLAEASMCACPVCLAVGEQWRLVGGTDVVRDPVAYWSAVSEQLRVLAAGEHRRVEWGDHVRALPGYDPAALATPAPGFNMGRDGGREGIGLGVGSGLPDRARAARGSVAA